MIRIVGVDCAVQPEKVGLALGVFDRGKCRVLEARRCGRGDLPAPAIAAWHREAPVHLLALDAPLGWPEKMGTSLARHRAGEGIPLEADRLFRRVTDLEIRKRLGKTPLDVGANFIARTARAALGMLEELRDLTGRAIPVAWDARGPPDLSAIEVYPSGTLRTLGLPADDYKRKSQRVGRARIVEALPRSFDMASVREEALASADVLDAVLCVLAGARFCAGEAVGPADRAVAEKEGWIWV